VKTEPRHDVCVDGLVVDLVDVLVKERVGMEKAMDGVEVDVSPDQRKGKDRDYEIRIEEGSRSRVDCTLDMPSEEHIPRRQQEAGVTGATDL